METTPKKPLLFDTCVFIGYLHRQPIAALWIETVLEHFNTGGVSTLTDFELWAGIRAPKEEKSYRVLLQPFRRFQLHTAIARRAGELAAPFIRTHNLSISIVDYLLAATAEYYSADLLTSNTKHFNLLTLKNVTVLDAKIAPQK